MLVLTDLLVLRVVPTTAELPLLVYHFSWQGVTLAGLWIFIVLYFSDSSLTQGFIYIYGRLRKWYGLIHQRNRKRRFK
jgi:hypothetical protein